MRTRGACGWSRRHVHQSTLIHVESLELDLLERKGNVDELERRLTFALFRLAMIFARVQLTTVVAIAVTALHGFGFEVRLRFCRVNQLRTDGTLLSIRKFVSGLAKVDLAKEEHPY